LNNASLAVLASMNQPPSARLVVIVA